MEFHQMTNQHLHWLAYESKIVSSMDRKAAIKELASRG